MANTTKRFSDFDHQQTLTGSYNDVNSTLGVDGFLVGKVGRGFSVQTISATVENFNFYEDLGATLLYTLQITYNNSTHDNVVSCYRIA